MEGRKFPNRVSCPPPVAEANPTSVAPGSISPLHSVISAAPAMTVEEAKRQKKRKAKKQKGLVEVLVAPSSSPGPQMIRKPKLGSPKLLAPEFLSSELDPTVWGKRAEKHAAAVAAPLLQPVEGALGSVEEKQRKRRKHEKEAVSPSLSAGRVNPEPKLGSPRKLAPETLSSELDPAVSGETRKGNQVVAVAAAAVAAPLLQHVEEAFGKEKKRKRKNYEKEAVSSSQSAFARAPIFEEDKTADVVAPAPEQGKREWMWVKEQEQSSQSPLPFDVHPQGVSAVAEGPKCGNVTVKSCSKYPRMPSNSEIIKIRIKARKQQPLPEGILDAVRMTADPSTTEKNSNYSSPFGAFFDQFCYEPGRRQNRKLPPVRKTSDQPARLPLQGCLSSGSLQLTVNGTSKAAKTPILNTPVSFSQETTQKKINGEKKQRKPKPSLRTDEKCSDKYRRVPLDQLVPPPRSPHKLLQEKYASDPWKVVVICMLLNLTQGKQVRKIIKGFFKRYPDPHTAWHADHAKMVEYLTPLGLQKVKATRIQRFSKDYVKEDWNYITELCGVGKYAADAYAIFCAGRATEVVPKDHKLVEYWNYVCLELPFIQGSDNAQEPGVTDQLEKVVPKGSDNAQEPGRTDQLEKVVPKVQESAVCF